MNHDYAHCLDYTPNCPKECFRAQLQRDLEERRSEFIGVPLTCSHLSGTVECKLANSHKKVWKGEWIPVSERLPEEKQDVLLAFRHNMVVGFWEDILNDGSQAWYANSGNAWFTGTESVDDDGIPIAWMPLPEPWKGEKR